MRKPIVLTASVAILALAAVVSLRADWGSVAEGVALQSTMLSEERKAPQPVANEREPIRFAGAYSNDGTIDQSRIDSVLEPVEIVSDKETVRVMLTEGDGEIVFDMNPSTNTTVLGRGAVIPPIRITRGDDSGVDVLVFENPAADRARQLLASKLNSGDAGVGVFHRNDLSGEGLAVQ